MAETQEAWKVLYIPEMMHPMQGSSAEDSRNGEQNIRKASHLSFLGFWGQKSFEREETEVKDINMVLGALFPSLFTDLKIVIESLKTWTELAQSYGIMAGATKNRNNTFQWERAL